MPRSVCLSHASSSADEYFPGLHLQHATQTQQRIERRVLFTAFDVAQVFLTDPGPFSQHPLVKPTPGPQMPDLFSEEDFFFHGSADCSTHSAQGEPRTAWKIQRLFRPLQ